MAVPVLAAVVAARAAGRCLGCPEHVGKRDGAVVIVTLIRGRATVGGLLHQCTPAVRIVTDVGVSTAFRRRTDRPWYRGDRAGRVEVRINAVQQGKVVSVRLRTHGAAGIFPHVGEVAHTRVLRAAVLGLVSQAKDVGHFLTHHVLAFVDVGVRGRVEVRVVHLGRTLRDMVAVEVDPRQAKPAIVPVAGIADLRGAGNHFARSG